MSKQQCISRARDYNHHAISARRIGDISKAISLRFARDGWILRARETE